MEEGGRPIRVLLIAGHSLFRQAVVGVLSTEPGIDVVAEAQGPADAISGLERTRPDVALIDADASMGHLPSAVTRMKDTAPTCKVLVLASEGQPGPLIDALQAGASGYLTRDTSNWSSFRATRSVHEGEVVVPTEMMSTLLATLLSQRGHRDEAQARLSLLTRREREVLGLLAQGADKDMIARQLVISPDTARTHVQNILAKLEVHSRLEAAALADGFTSFPTSWSPRLRSPTGRRSPSRLVATPSVDRVEDAGRRRGHRRRSGVQAQDLEVHAFGARTGSVRTVGDGGGERGIRRREVHPSERAVSNGRARDRGGRLRSGASSTTTIERTRPAPEHQVCPGAEYASDRGVPRSKGAKR